MKSKAWASVHCASLPEKSYNKAEVLFDQSPNKRIGQVTTDLAGKFCHPDGHPKSIVELRKVCHHSFRINSVNVCSHVIKLSKKKLLKPCLTTWYYDNDSHLATVTCLQKGFHPRYRKRRRRGDHLIPLVFQRGNVRHPQLSSISWVQISLPRYIRSNEVI